MKPTAIGGIVLIVLGVLALAYQGFTYRSRETVVDLGPIHATAEREKTMAIPPWVGMVGVGAGVVLLLGGIRKK